jgi:AcrR family transcriptional regulator
LTARIATDTGGKVPKRERTPRKSTLRRRAHVLDAALRCFARLGIGQTTIGDIQAASKTSIGSIYHHFNSKEDLAADLYVHCLELYQEDLIQKLEHTHKAERGVRTMVTHHLDWVAKNPARARFLFTAERPAPKSRAGQRLAQLNKQFFDRLFAWVEAQVDARAIRSLPRDLFFAIVVGPAQTYARPWLEGRRRTPPARARRALSDAAWAAVRGRR